MELRITGPEEQRVIRVAWFEIDTPAGNFVIHRGHAPMLVTLIPKRAVIIRLINGKQECIQAPSGIVHITRTAATIILGD